MTKGLVLQLELIGKYAHDFMIRCCDCMSCEQQSALLAVVLVSLLSHEYLYPLHSNVLGYYSRQSSSGLVMYRTVVKIQ